MAMHKRYSGDFLDIKGQAWTCEIWQESSSDYEEVGVLDFPADPTLTIEWLKTEKHEVICGSTATLTLNSPDDRTYYDLYSVRPGQIRLDVYRGDSLYWSGMLDPEHALEPYSSGKNYNVTLIFSDFGILKRLKYNMSGIKTAQQILTDALTRSGIVYGSVDQSMISLYKGTTRCTLDKLAVRSENYYDEEQQPMTVAEALEGILQPLALRMIQRAGTIYVYDLNGALAGAQTSAIAWASDDQVISVDRTYNNCKVAFSPYAGGDFFAKFEYTGEYSEDIVNLSNEDPSATKGVECYTYYPSYQPIWDDTNLSFTIFLDNAARGLAAIHSSSKYFHIQPLLGGSEEEGVALWFYTGGHGSLESGFPARKCAQTTPAATAEVMRTARTFLPKMSAGAAAMYRIRVAMSLLLDARYNPFEDASEYNEREHHEYVSGRYLVVAVPAMIQLYDASGNVLMHYTNKSDRRAGESDDIHTIANTKGSWVSGSAAADDCLLYYYKEDVATELSGALDGFVKNRQACNVAIGKISASIFAQDAGQYIPYPDQEGYLEISIRAGIVGHTTTSLVAWHDHDFTHGEDLSTFAEYVRWALFGAPEVDLVKSNTNGTAIDDEDVEYSGVINADAEEALEISTVVGTMPTVIPTAKGLLLDAATHEPIDKLTRAGRTDCPEQLLIGAMFSQYGDRSDVLSGTMEMPSGGFKLLTDASLPGKVLIPLAEEMSVRMAEDIVEAAELQEEEYTA